MTAVQQNTLFVTENNSDITTSDNGGNAGVYETILDLNVPTGVEYQLRPGSQLMDRAGLRVRMDLDDSGDNDLPDNASVRWIAQSPIEEDVTLVGTERTLRHFNNADQYDEDQVWRFDIEERYTFTEDAHLKLQLDSSTAVSWSDSWIELEIIRFS